MAKFTIRRFMDSDSNEIIRLNKLALLKEENSNRRILDNDLRNMKKYYAKDNGDFIVGLIGGNIVAMGALKKISRHTAALKRMRVHQNYQGNGLGHKILRYLEKKAIKLGCKEIRLYILPHQKKARKFYEKNKYLKFRKGTRHGLRAAYYRKIISE